MYDIIYYIFEMFGSIKHSRKIRSFLDKYELMFYNINIRYTLSGDI